MILHSVLEENDFVMHVTKLKERSLGQPSPPPCGKGYLWKVRMQPPPTEKQAKKGRDMEFLWLQWCSWIHSGLQLVSSSTFQVHKLMELSFALLLLVSFLFLSAFELQPIQSIPGTSFLLSQPYKLFNIYLMSSIHHCIEDFYTLALGDFLCPSPGI